MDSFTTVDISCGSIPIQEIRRCHCGVKPISVLNRHDRVHRVLIRIQSDVQLPRLPHFTPLDRPSGFMNRLFIRYTLLLCNRTQETAVAGRQLLEFLAGPLAIYLLQIVVISVIVAKRFLEFLAIVLGRDLGVEAPVVPADVRITTCAVAPVVHLFRVHCHFYFLVFSDSGKKSAWLKL